MWRWFTFLLFAVLGCDATGPALELEAPGRVTSVEARFGSHYCRRLDDSQTIDALVSFLRSHSSGWQPFWGQPAAPQVQALFLDGGRPVAALGLDSSQLVTRIGERPVFIPLSSRDAARFLDLLGGPPTAAPQKPCLPGEER